MSKLQIYKYFRAYLNVGVMLFYVVPVMIYFYFVSHFRSFRFEKALRRHCRILFHLLGVNVIVKGNLQPLYRQSVLIMPNHISYLDLPLLFGYLKVPMCGLEAHSHFRWWFYGKIVKRIGNIPVDRKNPIQSFHASDQLQFISPEKQIVIFPEAGRSRDGQLLGLKRMPFMVAKHLNRPVLPVFIYGMADVSSKRSWLIFPGEIVLFVRPVIESSQVEQCTLDELLDRTRKELSFAPFTRSGSSGGIYSNEKSNES